MSTLNAATTRMSHQNGMLKVLVGRSGCLSLYYSPLYWPRHLLSFPTRRSSDLLRGRPPARQVLGRPALDRRVALQDRPRQHRFVELVDRKSTRLNSSHVETSYAVFCLKKKKLGAHRPEVDEHTECGYDQDVPPERDVEGVGRPQRVLVTLLFPALLAPTSTLFPYTTLFRSPPRQAAGSAGARSASPRPACSPSGSSAPAPTCGARRSEEHTSELQSRRDLVCRLLLEKKKAWCASPRGR